jgi:hypothetical protein
VGPGSSPGKFMGSAHDGSMGGAHTAAVCSLLATLDRGAPLLAHGPPLHASLSPPPLLRCRWATLACPASWGCSS